MPSRQKLERADFWAKHMVGWESSGLSQQEYCHQQNINFKTFGSWRTLLKSKAGNLTGTKKPNPVALIPLSVIPAETSHVLAASGKSGIQLLINEKFTVDIAIDFHANTLLRLLEVIKTS